MYNASLALRMCQQFLLESPSFAPQNSTSQDTTNLLLKGLENATWPGRCQILPQGKATWFLDGAHTVESLALAGSWFKSASNRSVLLLVRDVWRGTDTPLQPSKALLGVQLHLRSRWQRAAPSPL